MKTLGQVAYEAYCESVGGKSVFTGETLPSWDRQKAEVRSAWIAAARAVIEAHGEGG